MTFHLTVLFDGAPRIKITDIMIGTTTISFVEVILLLYSCRSDPSEDLLTGMEYGSFDTCAEQIRQRSGSDAEYYIWYVAYGSNLLRQRLMCYQRAQSSERRTVLS